MRKSLKALMGLVCASSMVASATTAAHAEATAPFTPFDSVNVGSSAYKLDQQAERFEIFAEKLNEAACDDLDTTILYWQGLDKLKEDNEKWGLPVNEAGNWKTWQAEINANLTAVKQ